MTVSNFLRIFLAVFLIGTGIMLVLSNLGIADFGIGSLWHNIYPVFILVIGLKWLFDFLRRRGTHWFLGLFFVVFGSLLLLDRFEIITFYFKDVFKLWPLLIIYVGFAIFGFSSGRGMIVINRGKDRTSSTENWNKQYGNAQKFVVGDHDFSKPNWRVEPMNIRTMAGDFYMDFSKAYIPEGETPVYIRSLAGDVHLLVPETLEFRIQAKVKAGDIEILGSDMGGINRSYSYQSPNYEAADRKLDFDIDLKAGSIRLDSV
ncbi:cell wall-active antibiotics response protein LiaF [Oceanobacillus sp. CAU 1775]